MTLICENSSGAIIEPLPFSMFMKEIFFRVENSDIFILLTIALCKFVVVIGPVGLVNLSLIWRCFFRSLIHVKQTQKNSSSWLWKNKNDWCNCSLKIGQELLKNLRKHWKQRLTKLSVSVSMLAVYATLLVTRTSSFRAH